MSEMSLIVPLSILPEGTALTVEGLITSIADSAKHLEAAEHYRQRYNNLQTVIASAGNSLTLILTEVEGEFEKLQALRAFAAELTAVGKAHREQP